MNRFIENIQLLPIPCIYNYNRNINIHIKNENYFNDVVNFHSERFIIVENILLKLNLNYCYDYNESNIKYYKIVIILNNILYTIYWHVSILVEYEYSFVILLYEDLSRIVYYSIDDFYKNLVNNINEYENKLKLNNDLDFKFINQKLNFQYDNIFKLNNTLTFSSIIQKKEFIKKQIINLSEINPLFKIEN